MILDRIRCLKTHHLFPVLDSPVFNCKFNKLSVVIVQVDLSADAKPKKNKIKLKPLNVILKQILEHIKFNYKSEYDMISDNIKSLMK